GGNSAGFAIHGPRLPGCSRSRRTAAVCSCGDEPQRSVHSPWATPTASTNAIPTSSGSARLICVVPMHFRRTTFQFVPSPRPTAQQAQPAKPLVRFDHEFLEQPVVDGVCRGQARLVRQVQHQPETVLLFPQALPIALAIPSGPVLERLRQPMVADVL